MPLKLFKFVSYAVSYVDTQDVDGTLECNPRWYENMRFKG